MVLYFEDGARSESPGDSLPSTSYHALQCLCILALPQALNEKHSSLEMTAYCTPLRTHCLIIILCTCIISKIINVRDVILYPLVIFILPSIAELGKVCQQ